MIGLVSSESETSWAWAAGFFEGEGSITHVSRKGGRGHLMLSVTNTDRTMLVRFLIIANAGAIYESKAKVHPNRKTVYQLNIWRQPDVDRVIRAMWPWLSDRRRSKAEDLWMKRDAEKAHAYRERECPTCKESFVPEPSNSAATKVYCSLKCRNGIRKIRRAS